MAAGKPKVPGFRNVAVVVRSLSSSFQFSSFKEPEPNIFSEESLAALAASSDQKARDFQLRADFRAMGSILGNIIRDHEGEGIFQKVEDMRSLAKVRHENDHRRDVSCNFSCWRPYEAKCCETSRILINVCCFFRCRLIDGFVGLAKSWSGT